MGSTYMASTFGLQQRSSFLLKILHMLDCLLVVLILLLLFNIYRVEVWSEYYTYLAVGSFILSFICFNAVNLYRPWRGVRFYSEFLAILRGWAIFASIVLSLFFVLKIANSFSRVVIISWFIASPLAIFFFHLIIRELLRISRRRGKNLRYAVIVGAGDLGLKLASYIENIPWAGIKISGFFDDKNTSGTLSSTNTRILGTIDQLPNYLKKSKVDYVYIALPFRAEKKIVSILNNCRTYGAQIFMAPDIFAYSIFNADFQTLGEMLLINFNPDYRWKRYFDIVFSSIAIFVTLPFSLLVALLIKLEDGGPIFYSHKRITMAGKEFNCWKFRTMAVDAEKRLEDILANNAAAREEWEKTFKLKNDPRITKIGKILRKSSLDELPQFFNIVKGDMSIVGARPIVENELKDYYKENAGLYCSLKPGLTGPWQVGIRNDNINYDERIEKDLWYLQNLSFWLDLKIIFKTVVVVLNGKGAY
jgi:putative colanic acid biosynthesis UDP-glucose lipid carrier transferase